jgi:hypothetical protein
MKKSIASMMFLTLLIVASTTFAAAAGTPLGPGANVPLKTGVSSPGQFGQGMQTGTFGQGAAGGVAGGIQTAPGGLNTGQQGAGIWIGEGQNFPTGRLPGGSGGAPTCQCIAAPCNCPTSGGPLPATNFPNPNLNPQAVNQPFQTQPPQAQQFRTQPSQAQQLQPLTAPVGPAGAAAFGNAASVGLPPR